MNFQITLLVALEVDYWHWLIRQPSDGTVDTTRECYLRWIKSGR